MGPSVLAELRSRFAGLLPRSLRRRIRRWIQFLFRTDYERWLATFGHASESVAARLKETRLPSVGLVIEAAGAAPGALEATLASLAHQLHPELRVAVLLPPGGSLPAGAADGRIRALPGGGPAQALEATGGSLVGRIRAGTRLEPHALALAALRLARVPAAPLVYWDEDADLHGDRRQQPWSKPGWNLELHLGIDLVRDACLVRRELVDPRVLGSGAAWWYGAVLAALDAGPAPPEHLPFPLSTAPPDEDSFRAAQAEDRRRRVADWCRRRRPGTRVEAVDGIVDGIRLRPPLPDPPPRVSLLIPTRDRLELLGPCLDSLRRTAYPDLEILVVDNGSREPETLAYLARESGAGRIRVLRDDGPFNFSRLNNLAARAATGSVLCLLNNDTEATDPDWLTEMVSQALRPEVGAVGALLLFPDGSLQHAGVVLGMGHVGIAGHALVGTDPSEPLPGARLRVVREFSAVTGACLAIRRDLYLELGGLDEARLAVSFNDVDLCLRLRERGLKVLWTPFASLLHRESASVHHDDRGRSPRYQGEIDCMLERWGRWIAADPAYSPALALDRADGALAWPPRLRLEDEVRDGP